MFLNNRIWGHDRNFWSCPQFLAHVQFGGGKAFDNNACIAWPTAKICAMSVEGSVDVAYRRDYEMAEDPPARHQEIIDNFKSQLGA